LDLASEVDVFANGRKAGDHFEIFSRSIWM